jgi:hypothetical protein
VQGDFNPYREWLGLESVESPNHYELLSLPMFEVDAARIATAAERATTKVRSFRPGPDARAWSQLLDQIAEAKACLSDDARKAAYDGALRSAMPRQAARTDLNQASPPSALASLQRELYPPGIRPAENGAAATRAFAESTESFEQVMHVARQAPAHWTDLDPPGMAASRAEVPQSVPADVDPMAPVFVPVGDPASEFAAAAADAPVDAIVLPDAGECPFAPQPAGSWRSPASPTAITAGAMYRRRSPVGLLVVAICCGVLLAGAVIGFVVIANHRAPASPDFEQVPDEMAGLSLESSNPTIDEPPTPIAPRAQSTPFPQPPEVPLRSSAVSSVPSPAPPEPAPQPAPMPEQPPKVTRAEIEALIKSLEAAKAALGEQNFAVAEQQLAKAKSIAKLPKHAEAVGRLQEAGVLVKQFRQAIAAAVMGLEPGESFQVGSSTQVAFVSGSAEEVTLRIAGSNRRFPLNDLPPRLALELSEFKLDAKSPQGRVVQGAYLLFHKQTDAELKQNERERARALWEEALDAGADIERLMPLLTEDYAAIIKDATDGG